VVRRDRPDPALYLGRGKVEEIRGQLLRSGSGVVILDAALSPVQQRNLERELGVAVLDRTSLILDIFAQRAQSREGKLQVELARLQHLSTRLVRGWTHLERQRGGIGLRAGPGEKQIELDRRMIGQRVKQLRERLRTLDSQRRTRRRARLGLMLMYIAGTVSGLLGIGSGALKVPAMDLAMELPIKVSTATSNFMIGVTAAASAGVYFTRGQIDPFIAAPVAMGVLAGAFLGSHTLGRIGSRSVRVTFVIVLILIALEMLVKGIRG